jgi:hypothetical protein
MLALVSSCRDGEAHAQTTNAQLQRDDRMLAQRYRSRCAR